MCVSVGSPFVSQQNSKELVCRRVEWGLLLQVLFLFSHLKLDIRLSVLLKPNPPFAKIIIDGVYTQLLSHVCSTVLYSHINCTCFVCILEWSVWLCYHFLLSFMLRWRTVSFPLQNHLNVVIYIARTIVSFSIFHNYWLFKIHHCVN